MYSLSALYMPWSVPIVKVILVILFKKNKKKKKTKKKEKDPYFGMGEKPKLCHNNPAIYLFSWEREGILTPPTLHKTK